MHTEQEGNGGPRLGKQARLVVSVLVVLHLAAMFSAPWAYPPPSSQLARRVADLFRPYQMATFTRHGYRFFAPDPGPSYLVRYEIDKPDGDVVAGRFPDRDEIWPRLLYHRHFMISTVAFDIENRVRSAPEPDQLSEEDKASLQRTSQLADELRKGIARRLLDIHGGDRIRLYVQVHTIPFPGEVLEGQKLNDPASYQDLGEAVAEYAKGDL